MTYFNGNSYTSERKPKTLSNLLSCFPNGCFLQMFSSSGEQSPCPCAALLSAKIDDVVDEWLHEVPILASTNFDTLSQQINTLKNDLKEHSDNDDGIRKDIHKFLGNILLFIPLETKDRQQYKDILVEKLFEALKSKVRIKDRFSEIIQVWVLSLPTSDEEVDRYKYAECLNKCLRRVIADTDPNERKRAIRNFVLCELSKMKLNVDLSQQFKAESELAERLTDALAMYRLTPSIQKWISGIPIKSKPPIDKERLALDFSDKLRKTIATHEPAQRTTALRNMIHEELSDVPIETEPGVDKNDYINDLINKLFSILMLDELGKTIKTWIDNIPFDSKVVADKDQLAYNLATKLSDEINGSKKTENLKEITLQELYSWPLYVPETRKDEFLNVYAKLLVSKINDAGELIDINNDQKEALEYLKQQPEFANRTTGEIKKMIKEANIKPGGNQKHEYFSNLKDKLIAEHDLWIETMDEDEKQALNFLKNADGSFNDLHIGEKRRVSKDLTPTLRELRTKGLPDHELQTKMEDSANRLMSDNKEMMASLGDEEKEALKYLQMLPPYADLNADEIKKTAKKLANRLKNLKAKGLDPSEVDRIMKNSAENLMNSLIRPKELTKDELQILELLKQREEYKNMGGVEIMKAVKELGAKSKNLRDEGLSDEALITRLNKDISKWIDVSRKETQDLSEQEKEALKYLKGQPEYENMTDSEIKQGIQHLASKVKKLEDQGIVGDKLVEELEIAVDDWFDDRKDHLDSFDDTEMEILKKLRQRPEYSEMGRGKSKRSVKEISDIVKRVKEQDIKGDELDREIELEIDNYLNNEKQEMETMSDVEKKILRAFQDKPEYANLTKEEIQEAIEIIIPEYTELQEENASEEELEKKLNDEIEYWLSVKTTIKTTNEHHKTALELIRNSSKAADLGSEEKMRAMNELGKKVEELKGKGITGKRMQEKLKETTSDWIEKRNAVINSFKEDEKNAIQFLKKRPTFRTLTTDQLKDVATKFTEKMKNIKLDGTNDSKIMQSEANKLLRNLYILEELDEDEKEALEFIKKNKDYRKFSDAELKKATKQLGEKYKKIKQLNGNQLNEKMEIETADVMFNVRQERIKKLNDLDDDEKRVLEILKRRPAFSYLSTDEMKKTINKLGERMKDMKSEGVTESDIEENMHREASNILKNRGADLENLDEDELQALEYLKAVGEYDSLTNDELKKAAGELGSKLKELKKQKLPQYELDEIMNIEADKWLGKPDKMKVEYLSRESKGILYDELNDDEKVVFQALRDSPEYQNMTKDMIRDGVKMLGQKRKKFAEQGKSGPDLDTAMSSEIQNYYSKIGTAPIRAFGPEEEKRALELLKKSPGFADMTEDEKINATKYLAEKIVLLEKQNLNTQEYNKQEQEALKSAFLKTFTVNVTEWLEQTEAAQLKLSREESRQVIKYMLDNLWQMIKKRKSKDDIQSNMRILIKDKLESVFYARGQSVTESTIEKLTDMYIHNFYEEIVDSPFTVPDKKGLIDDFSANIKVWMKKNSELAKLPISSDKKSEICKVLAEDLANIRLGGKANEELEVEMIEVIKNRLSNDLNNPKKPFRDKVKNNLAQALLAALQDTITDWYIESYYKRESIRPSFSANTERLVSCMLSFSSRSFISTGPTSEINLLRAFVNDIREWMENTPEIASKAFIKKRKNKEFSNNLARKLYNIETTGTSDLEVSEEMKHHIELSLGNILPSANPRTLRMLSEKLLVILMETIDRVESSTSATSSEESLKLF